MATARSHSHLENAFAFLIGVTLVSLGLALFKNASLATGSTMGLAFLLHYGAGLPLGLAFFLINIPFYLFALRAKGIRFVAATFAAVSAVSVCAEWHSHLIAVQQASPFYPAAVGGILLGVGMLVLFRHGASLGGINIVALYLQERHGVRAGYFMLACDALILAASLLFLPWDRTAWSVLGIAIMNLVIALNHRAGRYLPAGARPAPGSRPGHA